MRYCAKHRHILRKEVRPPVEVMLPFVNQHKEQYWVGPICERIALSSYYEHKARERDPDRLPDRIKLDMRLELDIRTGMEKQFPGLWCSQSMAQLLRESIGVARCTAERLMKKLEMQGVRRGTKRWTTIAYGSYWNRHYGFGLTPQD